MLNENGNVGIGTASPGTGLVVANSRALFTANGSPSSGSGLEIGYVAGVGQILAYNRGGSSYEDIYIGDTLYVKGGGNVGIGTTNPTEKLEVGESGKKSFEVRPGTDYASLMIDGIEVARMRP